MQIMFAAALNLDPESVHAQMMYHMLAVMVITEPMSEVFGAPKAPSVIWMAILGAVGYKTLDGTLNKWVATAIFLANGAQALAPDSICDVWNWGQQIVKAMFSHGRPDALLRTYLGALLMDKSQAGRSPASRQRRRCREIRHRGRPRGPEDRALPPPLSRRVSPTRRSADSGRVVFRRRRRRAGPTAR